jgi:hypothetical protein
MVRTLADSVRFLPANGVRRAQGFPCSAGTFERSSGRFAALATNDAPPFDGIDRSPWSVGSSRDHITCSTASGA